MIEINSNIYEDFSVWDHGFHTYGNSLTPRGFICLNISHTNMLKFMSNISGHFRNAQVSPIEHRFTNKDDALYTRKIKTFSYTSEENLVWINFSDLLTGATFRYENVLIERASIDVIEWYLAKEECPCICNWEHDRVSWVCCKYFNRKCSPECICTSGAVISSKKMWNIEISDIKCYKPRNTVNGLIDTGLPMNFKRRTS